MSITSTDIHEQGFGTSRNGYDMSEVDDFLETVASEIDQLHSDYQKRIEELEATGAPNPEKDVEIARLRNTVEKLQARLSEQQADESVISDAFISAQKSVNKIKEEAKAEAEKILREADASARALVTEAQTEKQRVLDEIERLENSRKAFVNDFVTLIEHFRDDATKTFESRGLEPSADRSSVASIFGQMAAQRSYGKAPSASDDSIRQNDPVPQSSYKPSSIPQPKVPSSEASAFGYGATDGIDVSELD